MPISGGEHIPKLQSQAQLYIRQPNLGILRVCGMLGAEVNSCDVAVCCWVPAKSHIMPRHPHPYLEAHLPEGRINPLNLSVASKPDKDVRANFSLGSRV